MKFVFILYFIFLLFIILYILRSVDAWSFLLAFCLVLTTLLFPEEGDKGLSSKRRE